MKKTLILIVFIALITNINAQTFINYTNKNGLSSNYIQAIAIDSQNNKWFGTMDSGVMKFNDTVWSKYTVANGLINNNVKSIAIDANGNKWFGTIGGVSKFDGVNWTNYTIAEGLVNNNINSIDIDLSGNIWFGTNGCGVSKFDGITWTTYQKTTNQLINNTVNSIICFKGPASQSYNIGGNVWFGTSGGVTNISPVNYPGELFWKSYTVASNGIISDNVLSVALVSDATKNNLWFGTDKGVSMFDGSTITNYSTTISKTYLGLVNDYVNVIAIDKKNIPWFGTKGGILGNYKGSRVNYTMTDGILSNYIRAIACDADGNMWIGTMGGVSKYLGVLKVGTLVISSNTTTTPTTVSAFANSKASFTIQSDIPWTITSNASWLTVNKTNDSIDATIIVTSSTNCTTKTRTGTLTIKGKDGMPLKTFNITQDGAYMFLSYNSLAFDSINIPKESSSYYKVRVNTNTDWTASSDQSWLSVSPTKSNTSYGSSPDGDISIIATANLSPNVRKGIITVTCGGTLIKTFTVIQAACTPLASGTITGTSKVCKGSSYLYTVTTIAGTTDYIWTLPTGGIGTSKTNNILVNFGSTAILGTIKVKAQNMCGDGLESSYSITVTDIPDTAGIITGQTSVCKGETNILYSVPLIPGATSYTWTLPTGATGTSSTNSILVNFGSNAIKGNIKVKGHNDCGDGVESSILITVNNVPNSAGTITGLSTLCAGTTSTYTVPVITGSTSYSWILPTGATGSSTINSIVVNFQNQSVSGNITVKGNNSCGDGNSSNLPISVNPLPDNAGVISGLTTICQGDNMLTYSVPTIANALSYKWTLPDGATGSSTSNSITINYGISALTSNISVKGNNSCGDGSISNQIITVNKLPSNAGIISGSNTVCQGEKSVIYAIPTITNATSYYWTLPNDVSGTSLSNSILVNYSSTANSGVIEVFGINECGNGNSSVIVVSVNKIPADAGIISGISIVNQGQNSTYSVSTINNATSYIWTLPSGAVGSSNSNSINVNFSSSGDITVKGNNNCGDGNVSTLPIIVNQLPLSAGTIFGTTSVIQGQTVTYTVPVIANATSYIWTLPNGVNGLSTTNSITVDIGNNAVSGNITVKGVNSVGEGNISILPISVIPIPANAGIISGVTTVNQGQTSITYTVPLIANATSYIWTLPNGFTGLSTSNIIIVNIGATAISGDITVKGVNANGYGAISTISIKVNAIPATPTITNKGNSLFSSSKIGNQWYDKNGIILGANNSDYSPITNGDYYVIVTENGVSSQPSTIITVTNIGTDIVEINGCNISIYPVPVKDKLIVRSAEGCTLTMVRVISELGVVLYTTTKASDSKVEINMNSYPDGKYFIEVLVNGKTFTNIVVKE